MFIPPTTCVISVTFKIYMFNVIIYITPPPLNILGRCFMITVYHICFEMQWTKAEEIGGDVYTQ